MILLLVLRPHGGEFGLAFRSDSPHFTTCPPPSLARDRAAPRSVADATTADPMAMNRFMVESFMFRTMDTRRITPMGSPHAGVGGEKAVGGPGSGGGPRLRARKSTLAGPRGGDRSAAEVLEERADGQGVAPACKAGGRTIQGEVMEGMGETRLWHEEEERRGRDRIRGIRPYVARLDGAPADAIVTAFGALVGCVVLTP